MDTGLGLAPLDSLTPDLEAMIASGEMTREEATAIAMAEVRSGSIGGAKPEILYFPIPARSMMIRAIMYKVRGCGLRGGVV